MIANIGNFTMFGQPRTKYLTRLRGPVKRGDSAFYVETGLDLKSGDRLALLATSYEYKASDDVFVTSYSSASGRVEINSTIEHYHWGA